MNIPEKAGLQNKLVLQRLTALWAFSESGLGGVLHALQIPFTGLVVGGLSVLLITLIGSFSKPAFSTILKSLLVVLIVKAAVSPHTPFPAYVAVSFQALLGYIFFKLCRMTLISIVLLSTISMIESAIQKLLILTFFFGKSFWTALDGLMEIVGKQFSIAVSHGSYWLTGIYVLIYFIGGLLTAFMAYKLVTSNALTKDLPPAIHSNTQSLTTARKKSKSYYLFVIGLLSLSLCLWLTNSSSQTGGVAIVKALSWTLCAIVSWYAIMMPLATKVLQRFLHRQRNQYSEQVQSALSFIPVLQQLTVAAWKHSNGRKGWQRLSYFITVLIGWSLIHTDE